MADDRPAEPAPQAPALPPRWVRTARYLYAVGGPAVLLLRAVIRLLPIALEPIRKGMLGPGLWAVYLGWIAINAHAEGYRGFQKRFVPRVVTRARGLALDPDPPKGAVFLAPLYAMALAYAPLRTVVVRWAVVAAIVGLVAGVRLLGQPVRGIVDGGVVVGLAWGFGALAVASVRGRPR